VDPDADALAERGDDRRGRLAICWGSDEPLVSHSATVSAPACAAALTHASA
jgi:hypothetical protein